MLFLVGFWGLGRWGVVVSILCFRFLEARVGVWGSGSAAL